MRYLFRTVLGTALLAGGLTALCYGIAQAIEIGSCGTDEHGRVVGPPCPTGTGPMIGLMVGGAFLGVFGSGIYANRGHLEGGVTGPGIGMGIAIGQLRFWAASIPAAAGAALIGIVDLHEDQFKPGMEIVWLGAGSVIVVNLLGVMM